MNEYLAKLHSLESVTKAPWPKKSIVDALTKPDKTSSVSFVGDRSMGFSGSNRERTKLTPRQVCKTSYRRGSKSTVAATDKTDKT